MSPNMKQSPNMTAFTEDVLLMNNAGSLSSTDREAINRALTNNSAVGIIAGSYDDSLSISFASYYFLKNLGYEYDEQEYDEQSFDRSFLSLVHESDRAFFEPKRFYEYSGRFNFRVLMQDGTPLYAHAFKTDSVSADNEPQWVLSVRISWESVDFMMSTKAEDEKSKALEENAALNRLIQAMSQLIVRFAVCDIENDTYDFYDCGNGIEYEPTGTYTGLLQAMGKRLKSLSDSIPFEEFMSPQNLRAYLRSATDVYKFDYALKDESVYYNMSVVPMEWKDGVITKFVMLAQDITQPKLTELRSRQALREACDAANRANEAKTKFLSKMSHDIRTPMNAIIGMTAIAGSHIDQKDRVLDSLEKITSASRHLLSLINDLLDMSQIENGNLTLSEEEFNLSQLVDDMINMMKPDIESHKHDFEVTIRNVEHEQVIGDALKIQQMFTNIMGNAIKYTPDGGKIRLSISERSTHHPKIGCYEFVFEDNGIGMSQDFLDVIFNPFARADNTYVKDVQGSGLGMAITKNIVNMMNGDIKVKSAPGTGSTFTVTIFLQLQDITEDRSDEFYDLPVLVVDDDPICCETTVDTLNSLGMNGEWVNCGEDAIERTTKRHEQCDDYFAIIMDWKMPGMDGIETARRIRSRVGRDIPIIMLSAYDYSHIEQEAREAGIDCFIAKPLFKSRLKTVFRRLVNEERGENKPGSALSKIESGDYSGKRVLIVEDNTLNLEIATELIGATGVTIESASNGKEALDMVAAADTGYYDMIFMDIQMPVMNGYEATEAIRNLDDDKGKYVPIVAMTANAFAEDVIKAKNIGMNDHISKPVNLDKLSEILKKELS